jgi:RNA polymerase sigma factor (sigma-70 family)
MKTLFFEDDMTRLARKMKHGDQGAAEALYNDLVNKVFGFCLSRTGRRDAAQDLTQEIFLKLVSRIETFDEKRGSFPAWFWRLARNTVIDYYREKRDATFSDFPEGKIEEAATYEVSQSIDVKLELERLDLFLESISEEDRKLFEMRYIAQLSYKEISEISEKSEGALRVVVSRLKQKIKQHFNK